MRKTMTVVALLVLLTLVAGCQLMSGDTDKDAAGNGSGKQPTAAEREDAMLEFAACMRENGVPMDDPKPGKGGGLLIDGRKVDEATARAAEEKCHHLIEDALPDADELKMDPEDKEALLAQAACMRERGWDMPDPKFEGGRVQMDLGNGIDPTDPTFQEDQAECAEKSGMEPPRPAGGA